MELPAEPALESPKRLETNRLPFSDRKPNPPRMNPSRLRIVWSIAIILTLSVPGRLPAAAVPASARHGMVVAEDRIAAQVGCDALRAGGNAVDAAVATAFALAVTHPSAGNLGGGGFLLLRSAKGEAAAYDFREMAPAKAWPLMFLSDGKYDTNRHHYGYLSVGVPGTVAGLHLAWQEQGHLPWRRLVAPAIALARDGFPVSYGLAKSLKDILPEMRSSPAAVAQFSKNGVPYESGERLRQPALARTLARIARHGAAGFYAGETARLVEKEMLDHGGLITRTDLAAYRAKRRVPVQGTYRGCEILSMPPPSSGGVAIIEMLNILEGYDLALSGFGSADTVHRVVEAMRHAFADRARFLGDPDFNPAMPTDRLLSKPYAALLRASIQTDRASKSSPSSFNWPAEGKETTHLSVVDSEGNAVALTFTLEQGYGARIVVPGAGFLLNDEMGDFNAQPGLTTEDGLIGTPPNVAMPGKRMLSSMTPTIVVKDGKLLMVTGSPGGRTIISTVLETVLNTIDFGMNIQDAIDAPRFHHQWLPDRIEYEKNGLSPDTLRLLAARGHTVKPIASQGVAAAIYVDQRKHLLKGAADHRAPDSAAIGW
jgi:gamma-glutamyltranspeptidase/glutathione hydrolase